MAVVVAKCEARPVRTWIDAKAHLDLSGSPQGKVPDSTVASLPSQMLGDSQRNTANLLERALPELAEKGQPVVALIDEVDSIATDRDRASAGTDPGIELVDERDVQELESHIDRLTESLPPLKNFSPYKATWIISRRSPGRPLERDWLRRVETQQFEFGILI